MKIPGRRLVFAGADFSTSAKSMDAPIVIPVYNQLHFTRQWLDSLTAAGCAGEMIVVVNNTSTGCPADFLVSRPALRVISNPENRAGGNGSPLATAGWNTGRAEDVLPLTIPFQLAGTRITPMPYAP